MYFKRVALSALACCLLSSCDEGSNTFLAEGGIGGTGISVGSITAFGSIWVNGIRYDVSNANFIRDGVSGKAQDDFRLGEIVMIKGATSSDGVSGIAQTVVFDGSLEGTVSAASLDGATIEVLGKVIRIQSQTIFHGFTALTDLSVGNVLEVSGYENQGEVLASSVVLKQISFTDSLSKIEMSGMTSHVDLMAKTFNLGSLMIDYSSAHLNLETTDPQEKQYVEVRSTQKPQGNLLIATEVEGKDQYPRFESGQEVELEGIVTTYVGAESFSVSGQPVITDVNTRFENGTAASVKLNAFVEVEGYINLAGALVAEEVSLKQSTETEDLELEGNITALALGKMMLMVNGQTVRVDNTTILIDERDDHKVSLQFSELRVNDSIEVNGYLLESGEIMALKIEREIKDD